MVEVQVPPALYEALVNAAVYMCACNGGINRDRPEEAFLIDLAGVTQAYEAVNLQLINEWLRGLTEDQMMTFCDGEETARDALLVGAPPYTDELFQRIFDEAV